MEYIKASICKKLPPLAPGELQTNLKHLMTSGVESESNKRRIKESDLEQFLKSGKSRKLLSMLFMWEAAGTYTKYD